MIFRTLYSQLALTLFILLILVGLILIQIVGHSSTLYQQEASQKLNTKLAEHIVAEQSLMQDQQVNHQVLDVLFHDLMVTNPSIELYVLDKQGAVVGFAAPEDKIKRTRVDLDPVLEFLDGDARFPLKGDDPRNPEGYKVFSTTEIMNDDGLQGYLYIVLAGEQYDNVVEMLGNSFILDSALKVLLVALAAAMLIGLIVFAVQTRRFRILSNVIHSYKADADNENSIMYYPSKANSTNEIDLLGRQFNQMAEKIDTQIHELKQMDNLRREMVANVSHDLRTPLTTMQGYLETLQLKKSELSEQEREQYLETALSHSQYLGELVEELFELARLDSCESVVNSEAFSMGELVQDITQKYKLRAQQKLIQLEVELDPNTPLIVGDIAMMQRVLENLLENGLRYTPEGGHINISVGLDVDKIRVQVSDSGCGIPAGETSKIFERFYQRDINRSDSKNAGLGLAIVKRILELHGSVINVRSDVDKGTIFSFYMATVSTI
ncbi:MAG: sensor histidine kinase [Methylophagaceae bacterium]